MMNKLQVVVLYINPVITKPIKTTKPEKLIPELFVAVYMTLNNRYKYAKEKIKSHGTYNIINMYYTLLSNY